MERWDREGGRVHADLQAQQHTAPSLRGARDGTGWQQLAPGHDTSGRAGRAAAGQERDGFTGPGEGQGPSSLALGGTMCKLPCSHHTGQGVVKHLPPSKPGTTLSGVRPPRHLANVQLCFQGVQLGIHEGPCVPMSQPQHTHASSVLLIT